jgi:hypothetical protein
MWHWSVLESALNTALHDLCTVHGVAAFAITSNMGVRDKIHTVKTMLHLAHSADAPRVQENNKLLERIARRSVDRNIVAHTSFTGDAKGVTFFVVKAKGEFEIPDTKWTVKDFSDRNEKMLKAADDLRESVRVAMEWRRRMPS